MDAELLDSFEDIKCRLSWLVLESNKIFTELKEKLNESKSTIELLENQNTNHVSTITKLEDDNKDFLKVGNIIKMDKENVKLRDERS